MVNNTTTAKRQKILDTTLKMILESGIQNASMGKISKASGVAVGTIYHYFTSKEALVTELYKTLKLKMLKSFEKLEYPSDTKETFRLVMKTFINYALEPILVTSNS